MTTDAKANHTPEPGPAGQENAGSNSGQAGQGNAPPQRSMFTFYMIVASVVLPPVLATLFFLNVDDYHPFGFANKGNLVTPPQSMLAMEMVPVEQQDAKLAAKPFKERWTLFSVARQGCDEACRETLFKMRQTLVAQGLEDVNRVRYVLVTMEQPSPEQLQAIRKEHPLLSVVTPKTQAHGEKLLALLLQQGESRDSFFAAPRIHMVDPLSYWMMWYAPDANARGIMQDLERVLKISRIG